MNYVYVLGAAPPLTFGEKPECSSKEYASLLKSNLSKRQLKKIDVIKKWIDLNNLYLFLLNKGFDHNFDKRGNLSQNFLEHFEENVFDLPEYVQMFLQTHTEEDKRIQEFPTLFSTYYTKEAKKNLGFISHMLNFEHNLRIVLTGFRAKKYHKDIGKEFAFEDPDNPFVQHVLQQKQTKGDFQFPYEFQDLEKPLKESSLNPLQLLTVVSQYRFDFYGECMHKKPLSFEATVAYLLRLWVLEDYYRLSPEQGEQIFNTWVEEDSYAS